MPTRTALRETSQHKPTAMSPRSLLLSLLVLSTPAWANNLNIGVPAVAGNTITFTIAWDNSWNTSLAPNNWDAVWVFVKRQSCTDNVWAHAQVSTASVHTVTGGVLQVDPVTDGRGVFVRRSAVGAGNIATATVTLVLQTPANGVDNFQVFGIEMVSVPQGDFRIGLGGDYTFNNMNITSTIQAAGIGAQGNYICCGWGCPASLPGTFPLGWNNFYVMRYEISQEQFASFLNSLTYTQQSGRMAANPAAAVGTLAIANSGMVCRNGLRIRTSGVANNTPAVIGCDLNNNGVFNEAADGQNIACNHLAWSDLTAYLDWSALRPMTEFEYEKACRGPDAPPFTDYAWGTNQLLQATSGSLTNAGQASEASTAFGPGLCAHGAPDNAASGPLRCGFAAGATTRTQAGATWYGAMDMAGNVWEQCAGGHQSNYSGFTTANGDGTLHWSGVTSVAGWPMSGGDGGGAIIRGGYYAGPWNQLRVSDRAGITTNANQGRHHHIGGRGARSY